MAAITRFARLPAIMLMLAAALSLALTGCGRRGALEPPPSAGSGTVDPQTGVADNAAQRDRPFILDPLIQ